MIPVGVESLQKHEDKACGEQKMEKDGDYATDKNLKQV